MSDKTTRSILLFILLFSHTLATIAADRPYDKKRFQEQLEKAVSGDHRAQYRLGLAYLRGNGVKKDLRKARIWLEKAAEHGNARALYKLGMLHVSRRYGMYNPASAFRYFRQGAAKKHAESQYSLALAYYKGAGTAKDTDKAIYWARQAQKNHVNKAAVLLEKLRQQQSTAAEPNTQKRPVAADDIARTIKQVYSGLWTQDGKPAIYLPSGLNRCHVAGPVITCMSRKLRKSTDEFRGVYQVRSVLSAFTSDGSFKTTYRIRYLSVSPKKKHKNKQPGLEESRIPTPGWQNESTMRCRILGAYNLRCYTQDQQVKRYLRLSKKF